MWRLLLKITVVLLLAVGIGNYWVYLKTGQSPLSREIAPIKNTLDDQLQKTIDAGKSAAKALPDLPGEPADTTKAYKWVDSAGVVHYSDQPPAQGSAQIIAVDPNTNLIQGTAVSKTGAQEDETGAPGAKSPNRGANTKNPSTEDLPDLNEIPSLNGLPNIKSMADLEKLRGEH